MKTTSGIPLPTRAACTLVGLLCLIPARAYAANECQVKYTYAPSMGQSSTLTVNLDAGQTKSINQSNVLYVQNVKNHKVRVHRSGFGSYVELNQNGRDPGMGNYMGNVILEKIQCMAASGSSSSTPTYQTPAAMINALKTAGTSVNQVAGQVVAAFNVGGQQMAELLKAAGYDAAQVAAGLSSAFNANAAQAGQWLRAAGFSVAQTAQAIKTQFNATASVFLSPMLCGAAGCPSQQVALALKNVFNVTQGQLAGLMKGAGYTAAQIADGLKNAFNANGEQIAALLKAAQYDASQVSIALKGVFSTVTAGQMSQWLRQAGYSMNEVASVLRTQFNQSATQAAELLKTAFNATEQAIKSSLQAAGYTAAQIAEAFKPKMEVSLVLVLNETYGSTSINGPEVPMYPFRTPITYTVLGEGVHLVTSVVGLPRGAAYTLSGQQTNRLTLNVQLPTSSALGTNGQATLAGAGTSAKFPWRVTAMPTPTTSTTIVRPPSSTSNLPDLVPATFTNNLYKVGTATTMDDAGNTYTALDPFNNSSFCQGIPEGTTTRNNQQTANRRQITVPNVSWGVQNTSNLDISAPFNVKLFGGNTLIATQRVPSLAKGASVSFNFQRPQSVTTVAKVGLGGGCYHAGLRTEGWNDNAGFVVRVDTENEVSESNESNNVK